MEKGRMMPPPAFDQDGDRRLDAVAGYYRDLTEFYLAYGGEAGWHYGVWEDDTKSLPEALVRLNEILVEGLEIDRRARILDVGCGIGSFAAWCAEKFGCRATGITNCPEHIGLAGALAKKRGVESSCEFLVMDMDRMDFPDSSFDYVFNQETLCYAVDKRAYLQQILRLLKPGGAWTASAFGLRAGGLSSSEAELYERVRTGFVIPYLLSPSEVDALLADLGYQERAYRDLTGKVLKTARIIIHDCHFPLALFRLRLDRVFFRVDPEARRNVRGHFSAGKAFSRGLITGCFKISYHRARRPPSSGSP